MVDGRGFGSPIGVELLALVQCYVEPLSACVVFLTVA